MYKITIIILLLCFMSACNNTKQYNVYVVNHTADNIKVIYDDNSGDKSISLAPQERKMIISTGELETDNVRTRAEDCSMVAKKINAFNAAGKASKLEWCSEQVQFAVVDIGQGEFTLIYNDGHFSS